MKNQVYKYGGWIWVFLLLVGRPAWAGPDAVFLPRALVFPDVAVGDSVQADVVVVNRGDTSLVVSRVYPAQEAASVFSVSLTQFQVAPGDSQTVTVTLHTRSAGDWVDALIFETNLALDDPSLPRPVVSLKGKVIGPEITVLSEMLIFVSLGIGVVATQSVQVSNTGNDSLRVSNLRTGDARFSPGNETAFVLGPGENKTLNVAYTPDSSRARTDSLVIESNDLDEPQLGILLNALETPKRVGNARLTLFRADSLDTPIQGDTISVGMTLVPNGDAVSGVDVFFRFDEALFRVVKPDTPYVRTGFTSDNLRILNNTVVDSGAGRRVIHLSALSLSFDSLTTQGTLVQVDLAVVAPLVEQTLLRVLTEDPLFNTQLITPSGLSFTMPATNRLTLGNTPPEILPFSVVQTRENVSVLVALDDQATDSESAFGALTWTFWDPDSLVGIALVTSEEDDSLRVRITPPQGGFGTYPIRAVVTDPSGASDTAVVVVEVEAVNDPPLVPKNVSPVDQVENVAGPVLLQWLGSDPDRDDVLAYELRFGTNRLFLSSLAENLSESEFSQASINPETTYFWQIVVKDAAGLETVGPIWQFTSAADQTAPMVLVGPNLQEVTNSTVALLFTTDEPVRSRFRLGFVEDLSDSSEVEEVVFSNLIQIHNVTLPGLIPGTQYYYRLVVEDEAGNRTAGEILSFTTTGTKPSSDPPVSPIDLGDLDGDRVVGFGDFVMFIDAFGTRIGEVNYNARADFDGDGQVGFGDFVILSNVFGTDYTASKPAGGVSP
ncbi:MAG: choice-of-anchor D domain-containing protein [bacterium]|nr:choice-of-anchor D domain-containing protein [bacterium]